MCKSSEHRRLLYVTNPLHMRALTLVLLALPTALSAQGIIIPRCPPPRRGIDAPIVEWMGKGLLRTSIFPIQPGEERRVVVRYEMVAGREGDAVRVDYFQGTANTGQNVGLNDGLNDGSNSGLRNGLGGRTAFELT